MPIAARWRRLETLPAPRGRDPQPGVYELADEDKRIIYIGMSARDVPGRIMQHLSRPGAIREQAVWWRAEYARVPQAREAQLLAAYRGRFGSLPPLNTSRPLERDAVRRYLELSSSSE